VKKSFPLRLTC